MCHFPFTIRIFFLLGLLVSACQAQEVTEADFYTKLTEYYEETVPLIKADSLDQDYVILDTRAKEEYEVSHLPNATWVGYRWSLQQSVIDTIPKNRPILVYCSIGYRSERVGEKLLTQGFTQVYNLYGGLFDWANHGRPIVNGQNQPTDTVHTYNQRWSKWLFQGKKVW